MAKRKTSETDGADVAPAKSEITNDLPVVESPPLDPAGPVPAAEASEPAVETKPAEPVTTPVVIDITSKRRLTMSRRQKRNAMLAASLALAAGLGAVIGAAASGNFAAPARATDTIAIEERKALQRSVAHLTKEVSTLKTSAAAAKAATTTQIAKISDKITQRIERGADDITGSIQAPATVPVPPVRPMQTAPVAEAAPPKPSVVQGWTIRDFRNGNVYVEGRDGVFEVTPGAPLPGLGPVETIKRQDGRLVVVTPRGIIVSMRDRSYFQR